MSAVAFASSGWAEGWYVVPYEVTWRDVDAAGHVNNAVYFTLFEYARTKYWTELNAGRGVKAIDFIVARAECNFRRQLSMLDRVLLCVRIENLRSSSFEFVSEIRREADGTVAADGKVVAVQFDWSRNTKVELGTAIRDRIAQFQKE